MCLRSGHGKSGNGRHSESSLGLTVLYLSTLSLGRVASGAFWATCTSCYSYWQRSVKRGCQGLPWPQLLRAGAACFSDLVSEARWEGFCVKTFSVGRGGEHPEEAALMWLIRWPPRLVRSLFSTGGHSFSRKDTWANSLGLRQEFILKRGNGDGNRRVCEAVFVAFTVMVSR